MFAAIIVIHVLICVMLIIIILVQRGHGGGLVESLSNLDSMFGTKTNSFLSRATSVLASLFIVTCLSLAVLSARQGKSIMSRTKAVSETPLPAQSETAAPAATTAQAETPAVTPSAAQTPAPTPAVLVPDTQPPAPAAASSETGGK